MSVPPGEDRISLSESEEDSFYRRKSAPLSTRGSRRFSRDELGWQREKEPAPPGTEELEPQVMEKNREKRRSSREGRESGEKRRRSRSRRGSINREQTKTSEKEEDIFPPGEFSAKEKTEPNRKESRPKSPTRQRSRRSKSRERFHRSRSRERFHRSRDRSRKSRSRDRSRRSRSRDRHRRAPPTDININNGTWRKESIFERSQRQEDRKHLEWKKKSDEFLAKLGIPSTSMSARPIRPMENMGTNNLYGADLNSILTKIGIGVGVGSEQLKYPSITKFSYPQQGNPSSSPANRQYSPPPARFSPRRKFSPPPRQLSPFQKQFSAPSRTFSPPGQFSPIHRQFSSPPRQFSSRQDFSPSPRQFSAPRQYSPLRNRSRSPSRFSNSPPPSQFAELFSSIGGYKAVSAPPPPSITTQDLDFRGNPLTSPPFKDHSPANSHDPDTLPHGNYLVASWDILTVGGGISSSIYQIGCFLPHGLSYNQCVLPEEGIEEAIDNAQIPLLQSSGAYYVQHPVNKQLMACSSEKVALTKFLLFLERGCTSTRPAYDGVVLVSHILESIPLLLKAVKKHNMEDAFYKTAKGFGDLCTFMAQNHSRRFIDEDRPSGQMNLSLNVVYRIIFGKTINLHSMTCDGKAQASYEILVNLLDDPPNYQNFMKTFIHPPQSAMMTKLANYRTIRERMELFRPLERYISKELAEQQVELLVTGMYAPSAEEEEKHLTEPQQVAVAMCRMLVSSGFDFDRLLTLVKERGVADLELTLRTVFLGKMAGQTRAVVDQTIRTTRLVVAFFTMNGHKSLDQLLDETRDTDFLNSIEIENDRFQEDRFKVLYKEYKVAKDYFGRRLLKIMNSPDAAKVSSEMLINCLLQSGLDYDKLEAMYAEDKKVNINRNRFRQLLQTTIGDNYEVHGPPDVSLNQLIELVIDFFGNQSRCSSSSLLRKVVAKAASGTAMEDKVGAPEWYECTLCKTKGHWRAECSMYEVGGSSRESEESILEKKIKILDSRVKTMYHTASTRADYLSRMNSLVAIKRFIVQKIQPHTVMCGGSEKQVYLVAESIQKLMALNGFSHYSLKSEYDKSENNLAGKLFAALREQLDLLPHGINLETMVDFVISYFKQYFPFRSAEKGTTSGGKMYPMEAPGCRNTTSR